MQLGFKSTQFTIPSNIVIPEVYYRRLKTGIEKIDKMLGGGFLPGSSFTLSARAGLGKSTLMLQVLEHLALRGYKVGYITGEESIYQIGFTCKRIGVKNVLLCNETDVDEIAKFMEQDFDIVIIDSFNALTTKVKMNERVLEKYAVNTLSAKAKETECVVGFIVHVTKGDEMKGSTALPHTVDVNIRLGLMPDSPDESQTRILYIDKKNRFGPLGDAAVLFTSVGYDFESKVETKTNEEPVENRAARKQNDYEKLIKQNVLDLQGAAELLDGNIGRARQLLRDLVDSGKMVKQGRGTESLWKSKA